MVNLKESGGKSLVLISGRPLGIDVPGMLDKIKTRCVNSQSTPLESPITRTGDLKLPSAELS